MFDIEEYVSKVEGIWDRFRDTIRHDYCFLDLANIASELIRYIKEQQEIAEELEKNKKRWAENYNAMVAGGDALLEKLRTNPDVKEIIHADLELPDGRKGQWFTPVFKRDFFEKDKDNAND